MKQLFYYEWMGGVFGKKSYTTREAYDLLHQQEIKKQKKIKKQQNKKLKEQNNKKKNKK